MKKCPDMCYQYWSGHPFNSSLGLICPGCEGWTDKDGKKWRRMNLPDGEEIHPEEEGDNELKPCPFCGLPAKMHTAYYVSEFADSDDNIPADALIVREWRKPKTKEWTLEFRRRAYVPQCSDPTCIGRLQKKFPSADEAVTAWNRRADNG